MQRFEVSSLFRTWKINELFEYLSFFFSERRNNPNFECEVEPTSTSYAALENMSSKDDDYNPYAGLNIDLCLEVDAIDLNSGNQPVNDDYDPYEVFMKMNTRRTVTGRDRAPLAVLPSHAGSSSALVNNYRNYNFAEDDTPVKYPLAIGHVDRRVKQPPVSILIFSFLSYRYLFDE